MRKTVPVKWKKLFKLIPNYNPMTGADEFWFDPKEAAAAIDFFELCLVHVEGAVAGKPFLLEDWQKAFIGCLFGWKRRADNTRRYRKFLLYVPRKNGKTPIAAGIVLKMLIADGEIGAQVYGTAGDKEQARLLYRHAAGMAEASDDLAPMVKVMKGYGCIEKVSDPGSIYKAVTAKADTKHGGNPHCCVIDELHIAKADLVDVIRTSMSSANRKQPLLVYTTTADYLRESPCNEVYAIAKRLQRNPTIDPTFLPVVYEIDKDDDWTDPKSWAKANPNLGVSVDIEHLKQSCKNAQEITSQENTFRRLHLNQQTESDKRWCSLLTWDDCKATDRPSLIGRSCYAGLDLASQKDLTALVLVFPGEDEDGGELYDVLPFAWLPEYAVDTRTRKDDVPYRAWVQQGLIKTTPGDVTDYDVIRNHINEIREQYQVEELAFDPWQALQLAGQLDGDNCPVVKIQQTTRAMSPGVKKLEELILKRRLFHDGNIVLRWCIGNAVAETDSQGRVRLDKKRSGEKIDLAVALAMAIGRAMLGGSDRSVYEERGLLVL